MEFTKSKSSAHNILPKKNVFNSSYDHDNVVHQLFTWGLPLIDWFPMLKNTGSVHLLETAYNLKSNVLLQISFYRNESSLKLC